MKRFDINLIEEIQRKYDSGIRLKNLALEYITPLSTLKLYIEQGSQKKILTEEQRRKGAVVAVGKRRRKIKRLSVEYKGGCCQKCGYNKCIDALDFHHIDESKKEFSISMIGYQRSWERVKKELDKCVLLCANCHREEHANNCNCLGS